MELELGMKFTRVVDEFTSDLLLSKHHTRALFFSHETTSMFVLTAHLKGYKRESIKIDINEDGSLMGISGEKQIKECVIKGWKLHQKDAQIQQFNKVFRIPDGVILDKIKAMFNEDESTLTITMPKKVHGIRGTTVEEHQQVVDELKSGEKLKEKMEDHDKNAEVVDELKSGDKLKEKMEDDDKSTDVVDELKSGEKLKENVEDDDKNADVMDELKSNKLKENVEKEDKNDTTPMKHDFEVGSSQRKADEIEERIETKEGVNENDMIDKEEMSNIEKTEEPNAAGKDEQEKTEEVRGKNWEMCLPIVAGSTLVLSFVVFVIQIIRTKNQKSMKRE